MLLELFIGRQVPDTASSVCSLTDFMLHYVRLRRFDRKFLRIIPD